MKNTTHLIFGMLALTFGMEAFLRWNGVTTKQ